MKKLILLALLAAGCTAERVDWYDKALPQADPAKALRQGLTGKRVRIPDARTPEQIKAEAKAEYDKQLRDIDLREYKRGSWMVTLGLIVAACAIAAHIMTSLPAIKRIAEGCIVLGAGLAGSGFIQRKIVEFDTQLGISVALLITLGIAYKARNWSISRLFKRKQHGKKDNGTTHMQKSNRDSNYDSPDNTAHGTEKGYAG